jgi:hypothetical protein
MTQVGIVIVGIVIFLAFCAFADNVTDQDDEERKHKDEDPRG